MLGVQGPAVGQCVSLDRHRSGRLNPFRREATLHMIRPRWWWKRRLRKPASSAEQPAQNSDASNLNSAMKCTTLVG